MITGPGGGTASEEITITNEGITTRVSLDIGPDRVHMIVSSEGVSVERKLTAHDADRWASALATASEKARMLSGPAQNN